MNTLSLKRIYSGKVRDLYEIDSKTMLIVATDRLSAFDVILDEPIVGKGEILTQISNFWFGKLAHIMPNHFTGQTVFDVLAPACAWPEQGSSPRTTRSSAIACWPPAVPTARWWRNGSRL